MNYQDAKNYAEKHTRDTGRPHTFVELSQDFYQVIEGQAVIDDAPPDNFQDDDFDKWEQPLEIVSELLPVQEFTCDLLPKSLRGFVADVTHRMQTPPDFVAASLVAAISSIVGAGCGVRPKKLDDWEVIPNLWGACIGSPSVLKTPSMKESLKPIEQIQAIYAKTYEAQKIDADFDAATLEAAKNDINNRIKLEVKKTGGDVSKLKAEYAELMQSEQLEIPRRIFKVSETSVQSMTKLQNENPRGVLVFRDELMGLLATWDKDDKADERAYFLEGWNGNGSYTDIKLNRGLTDAKNISISLLGSIQPDKLNRYLTQAKKGSNDGLVQRLQLAVYPNEITNWQYIDKKPNREERERVFAIIEKLCELDFLSYGAIQEEYDSRPYFRFALNAQDLFIDWLTDLQNIKLKDDNNLMVEHLSKYRSLMPSLALLFHLVECVDNDTSADISAGSTELAIRWCEYLESHARRIYGMNATPQQTTALNLLKRIEAGDLPSPFTAKIVYDRKWHGLANREEVEAACEVLIEANYLKIETPPKPKTGRPALSNYFISPFLKITPTTR